MDKAMNRLALCFYAVVIALCFISACGFAETLELWRLIVAVLVGVPLTLIYRHYGIFKAITDNSEDDVEDCFD